MTAYRAVPYLVVAAPPAILLLAILMGGCSMTRTISDPASARSYTDPTRQDGEKLADELDRRAAREALRRVIDERAR
jgi:hypothetical protein